MMTYLGPQVARKLAGSDAPLRLHGWLDRAAR
jgi:hypothetical protein